MNKVFAVASGGGHWKQLMYLRDGLETGEVVYATTVKGLAKEEGIERCYLLPDASRTDKIKLLTLMFVLLRIVLIERPSFIVTTGAAPGLIAIMCGRLVGAQTLWIDSIANGEELSLCGKLSTRFAHVTLSQWESLSNGETIKYHGSVI